MIDFEKLMYLKNKKFDSYKDIVNELQTLCNCFGLTDLQPRGEELMAQKRQGNSVLDVEFSWMQIDKEFEVYKVETRLRLEKDDENEVHKV